MALKIRSGSAPHWVLRAIVVLALILVVLQIATGSEPSTLGKFTEAMALAIAALSLNLLFGFNGQISLGHSAFAGVSAFFLGYSVRFWDNKPFVSLAEACVLCFLIGLMVGLPALRVRGTNLARFVCRTMIVPMSDWRSARSNSGTTSNAVAAKLC